MPHGCSTAAQEVRRQTIRHGNCSPCYRHRKHGIRKSSGVNQKGSLPPEGGAESSPGPVGGLGGRPDAAFLPDGGFLSVLREPDLAGFDREDEAGYFLASGGHGVNVNSVGVGGLHGFESLAKFTNHSAKAGTVSLLCLWLINCSRRWSPPEWCSRNGTTHSARRTRQKHSHVFFIIG